MSLNDNVYFSTRERALSSDVNNLESIIARTQMEVARWMTAVQTDPVGTAGSGSFSPRSFVLGGLTISPAGNDVAISEGVLMQQSFTLAPTPGPNDSPFRYGKHLANSVFTMPSPGSETYYLLEAQVVQVLTSSQTRDIYDPGTNTFIPTLVPVQYTFEVNFQLLTGNTSFPTPTGGDWVVLAGVRRPAGGGVVAQTDIYDVAPRWSDFLAAQQHVQSNTLPNFMGAPQLRTVHQAANAVSNLFSLNAKAEFKGKQYYCRATSWDPTGAAFLEAGLSLSANTWYYVYLSAYNGVLPKNAYASNLTTDGVLTLSNNAPVAGMNAAPFVQAAPFSQTVGTGEGVCIGAVCRNNTNNGWMWQQTVNGVQYIEPILSFSGAPVLSGITSINLFTSTPPAPGILQSGLSMLMTVATQAPAPAAVSQLLYYYSGADVNSFVWFGPTTQDDNMFDRIELPITGSWGGPTGFGIEYSGGISAGMDVVLYGYRWWQNP